MLQKAFFSIQNIKKCFFLAFLAQKKKIWKKVGFVEKNHGLTPLQNVDFFDFFRISLFRSKKQSFLSRILKNVSFWRFLLKKNISEKGRFFDENRGLTPFQNAAFLEFFRTFLLCSKKHSFPSKITKNVFFWLSWLKKKRYEKKLDLLRKTMD